MKTTHQLKAILNEFEYPHPTSYDLNKLYADERCTREEVVELAHLACYKTNADIQSWKDNSKGNEGIKFSLSQKKAGIPTGIWRGARIHKLACVDEVFPFTDKYCKGNEDNYKGLLIIGKNGTSKTYTTCAVLNEVISRTDKSVRIIDFAEFYNQTTKTRNVGDYIEFLEKYDLLAIDNVSTYKMHDFKLQYFLSLLRSREIADKPTIITSNLEPSGLYAYFSANADKKIAEEAMYTVSKFKAVYVDEYRVEVE